MMPIFYKWMNGAGNFETKMKGKKNGLHKWITGHNWMNVLVNKAGKSMPTL